MLKFCDENRRIIIVTFLSTLFVHLIKILNYYPTPDSMYGIEKSMQGMISFGRWFSGIAANITSSPYDLQWVGGVVSAVFISFAVCLFLKIFDVKESIYQYLCIASFVTYPCVTATFVYSLWTSAYMSAFFLAVLVPYICIYAKNNVLCVSVSAFLLAFSLGTYQIYFTFSLLIMLFYVLVKLMNKEKLSSLKTVLIRFFISFIAGALIYVVVNKIVLALCNVELADYQGISGVHVPNIEEILAGFKNAIKSFRDFFAGNSLSSDFKLSLLSLYLLINIIIIILLGICIYRYIFAPKDLSIRYKILMAFIIMLIIPVGYVFYFVSSGVDYHRVMEFGNYFVYFLLIIFLQHSNIASNRFKKALIISLILISAYNFINANISYHQMSISYEKTYFQNIEIASRIDDISDEDSKTVAVIGEMKNFGKNLYSNPDITGASTKIFTWKEPHVIYFANYYLGRNYVQCSQKKKEEIMNSVEYSQMEDFPSKNSIKVIDGIIVVKLSDVSYED